MRKIAFTGHRLSKLPFTDESDPRCAELQRKLFCEAQKHLQPDQTVFLSGMANGVDLWAAEAVVLLKNAFPLHDIQLWAVVPYRRQMASWPKALQDRYQEILSQADKVILISEEYTPACLHQRNQRLVDEADHLIAVYDGKQAGGTKETIDYARKKGLDITIIEPYEEVESIAPVH